MHIYANVYLCMQHRFTFLKDSVVGLFIGGKGFSGPLDSPQSDCACR